LLRMVGSIPLSVDDITLLATSCASSAVIIYVAVRNARSRRGSGRGLYGDVIGQSITSFFNDYLDRVSGGKTWFKVKLSDIVAGDEFSGSWDCLKLGSGGWGTVYLLKRDGTYVVVKVPHGFEPIVEYGEIPTVPDKVIKKISEEAEILSRLNHPHILKLIYCSRKAPVMIYEFANYGTLEWQVRRGWKPSLREVLMIGVQLADAVRYVHTRGLVHGDIKSDNVFIVNGVVKLGDFSSLKKLLSATSRSSWSYTPGWRAPEQAYSDLMKKASKLGLEDRIDVYLLGNLILYLTTGKLLDGEDAVKPGMLNQALRDVKHGALRELLRELLAPRTEERLSASETVKRLYEIYKSA